MQEAITDDALETHLVLHNSRISNFQLAREEVPSALIMRRALGQGSMPMDIGALDATGSKVGKSNGKGETMDKLDTEMTRDYCSKIGHRKVDCWSWHAEKEKEKQTEKKGAAPKKGVKKEVAAVEVGSLEVGPPSASASESWILSVEVVAIDEACTTHHETA